MTYRKRQKDMDSDPIQDFMDAFGVTPGEAAQAFRDPSHPLIRILEHLRKTATTDLVDEADLTPHGYRYQGVIRTIDNLLSIPDKLKELS